MNFMRETEQYYDWLYKIVCGEWEPRNLSFHRLLMYLFNRDYIPACEMDVCRATDGINLRYRFASENNIPYGKIDRTRYASRTGPLCAAAVPEDRDRGDGQLP